MFLGENNGKFWWEAVNLDCFLFGYGGSFLSLSKTLLKGDENSFGFPTA